MPLVSFTTVQYTVYQELEKLIKLSLSFLFEEDNVKKKISSGCKNKERKKDYVPLIVYGESQTCSHCC